MALIPPDARAARDFNIIKGTDDNINRTDYQIDSGVTALDVGEWVVLNASNKVVKATGLTLADPGQNVACCWTKYAKNDTYSGQTDALATNQVTCVSGSFQAQTKLFEPTGTFTAGFLLVVRENSGVANQGVLDAVDGATASAKQIAAHVGKVVLLSGGVLTFRTTASA